METHPGEIATILLFHYSLDQPRLAMSLMISNFWEAISCRRNEMIFERELGWKDGDWGKMYTVQLKLVCGMSIVLLLYHATAGEQKNKD